MARTFSLIAKYLTPAWLRAGEGGVKIGSWMALVDASVQRMYDGVTSRFPTYAGDEALKLLGEDRGILRGKFETREHYAERLKRWRSPRGHRVRGSAFALLEQVSEYFGGLRNAWTIDQNGTYHKRTEAGAESYTYGTAWVWDQYASTRWARFWLVIEDTPGISGGYDFGDPRLWGGAVGTPGTTIGLTGVAPEDFALLRSLVNSPTHPWRPLGVTAGWIIVSLTGIPPVPDVTWEHWSKNYFGTQIAARDDVFRYIAFDSSTNIYAGNPDSFASHLTLPDDSTYDGDPGVFDATIALPDGTMYAGDPDSFPHTIQLLDDGDLPQW